MERALKLRLFCAVLLLTALLAGCTQTDPVPAAAASSSELTIEAPTEPTADEQLALVGVWRNAGQYSEGRDFIETMTLDEGGICTVVLDYQGQAAYQTLTGVYFVLGGELSVTFSDAGGGFTRSFRYTLDGNVLRLVNEEKTVEYIRIS